MEGVMSPKDAGRYVTENSKNVSILDSGVIKLAKILYDKVKTGEFDVKMWRRHELNPQSMDEDAINWVFLTAVLNFSFWSEKSSERYVVKYNGKDYTGYWALCAAINRALDENYPITKPSYYATISEDILKHIFRSDSEYDIPLLDRRHNVLLEAGKVLMEKYEGTFVNVIKDANKSAQTLLKLILNNFPSFQDVAEFNGKKVGFYKRAQILIGDVWGCLEGQGLGEFTDIDTITMFADYRIPQALVYFGVLLYSDSLMNDLKKEKVFQSGDKQEVEIRGVSLWACELIRDEIVKQIRENESQPGAGNTLSANAILVDHYLWDTRREMADQMEDIPFHRCRGIYY